MEKFVIVCATKEFRSICKSLTPTEDKIRSFLFSHSNSTNRVMLNRKQIAEGVGMSVSTVSAAFKTFVEVGICKKPARDTYFLNPDYVWCYDEESRLECLKEYQDM
jgi:hypothetical protein